MATLSKFTAALAIAFGIAASFGHTDSLSAATKKSETIAGTTISYDADTVLKADVIRFGEFLEESGFSDGNRKEVALKRIDERWQMEFMVGKQFLEDEEYAAVLSTFAKQISLGAFDGQETEIRIHWGGKSKVIKASKLLDGRRIHIEGLSIYFDNSVSEELAQAFGDFLNGGGFCDGTEKDSQLSQKEDGSFIIKFVVAEESRANTEVVDAFQQIAAELSAEVFSDAVVVIELCDYAMTAKKTVKSTSAFSHF